MRTGKLLICLSAAIIGLSVPLHSGLAQILYAGRASSLHYASSDYTFAPGNRILTRAGFLVESNSATRLSLRDRPGSYSGHPLASRMPASFAHQSRSRRVDYKRASVLGTANAAALFSGFKGAIEAWGESRGAFHFKDDWNGDKLKQTDELSHFM